MKRINRRQALLLGTAFVVSAPFVKINIFNPPIIVPGANLPGSQLLIRTVDGENWERPMTGDVVNVLAGGRVMGCREDFDQWVAEGRDPNEWPNNFQLVYLPTVPEPEARIYQMAGDKAYRVWKANLAALKRLSSAPPGQHKMVLDCDPALIRACFSRKPGITHKAPIIYAARPVRGVGVA